MKNRPQYFAPLPNTLFTKIKNAEYSAVFGIFPCKKVLFTEGVLLFLIGFCQMTDETVAFADSITINL
jgi:hypothetical protein